MERVHNPGRNQQTMVDGAVAVMIYDSFRSKRNNPILWYRITPLAPKFVLNRIMFQWSERL